MEIYICDYIRVRDIGLSYTYDIKREFDGEVDWRHQDVYFPNPELAIKDSISNHMKYKTRNKEFKDISKFIDWKTEEIKKLMEDIGEGGVLK